MSNKQIFAENVRQAATDFANYEEKCEKLARMFYSREYGEASANELTQTELDAADVEMDVTDLRSFVTIFDNMKTWLDTDGRRQVFDRLRRASL